MEKFSSSKEEGSSRGHHHLPLAHPLRGRKVSYTCALLNKIHHLKNYPFALLSAIRALDKHLIQMVIELHPTLTTMWNCCPFVRLVLSWLLKMGLLQVVWKLPYTDTPIVELQFSFESLSQIHGISQIKGILHLHIHPQHFH